MKGIGLFIMKGIELLIMKGIRLLIMKAICVLLPWRSGLVRSTSAIGGGEWLWVQAPSMVVGTPCRGP